MLCPPLFKMIHSSKIFLLVPKIVKPRIYFDCSCLLVCLYPINAKTAEPIRPKFFVGPRVNPRKVYEWWKFKKIVLDVACRIYKGTTVSWRKNKISLFNSLKSYLYIFNVDSMKGNYHKNEDIFQIIYQIKT